MSSTLPPLFAPVDEGWIFSVRVTPKASTNSIVGLEEDQNGSPYLKLKVTTVPEDGKANAAVIKLLAKSWKVPKGSISIVRGDTNRNKTLKINCGIETRDDIVTQLERWTTKR